MDTNKRPITTDQEYVAKSGLHCPNCDSTDLSADRMEQDDAIAWQNIDCNNCGAYWTDQYNLIGYGNFHFKDEELAAKRE